MLRRRASARSTSVGPGPATCGLACGRSSGGAGDVGSVRATGATICELRVVTCDRVVTCGDGRRGNVGSGDGWMDRVPLRSREPRSAAGVGSAAAGEGRRGEVPSVKGAAGVERSAAKGSRDTGNDTAGDGIEGHVREEELEDELADEGGVGEAKAPATCANGCRKDAAIMLRARVCSRLQGGQWRTRGVVGRRGASITSVTTKVLRLQSLRKLRPPRGDMRAQQQVSEEA